jgi:uncharacterized membrane protein
MFDPVTHIAHRQRLSSPTLSRAHEGNLAAQRLAGVKQAYESYRREWQDFHRAYDEAGDNYRAAHEMELSLCDEIMAGLLRDYRAAVAAEHISIYLERNAA